jgi:membrane protein implicated in regulation of membrane protease activity
VPLWAVWIVVGVALLAVEATTTAFVAIYFGAAALVVSILAVAGVPLAGQLIAFGGLSVAGLALTRPALRRMAGQTPELRTGVDALAGRTGVVVKEIGEYEPGQVRIGGETWTARAYFEHERIAAGRRVEVVRVRGVTALVVDATPDHQLPEETST